MLFKHPKLMDDESFFSTQTWGLSFKTVRNPNLKEESSPNIIITSDSPMRKLCESSHPTRVFISNCSSSSKHGGFYVKNLWLVFCLALCPKIADGRITRRRQYVLISSNVFVINLFYPQNWMLFWKTFSNRQPESQSLREFLYGLNKEKGGGYTYFSNEEKIVQI